jgi:hypothetical protein
MPTRSSREIIESPPHAIEFVGSPVPDHEISTITDPDLVPISGGGAVACWLPIGQSG